MISWFQGGEVFRSLCTWRRGHGQVVYFRPGHETYPTYHHPLVRRIVVNAAAWARRRVTIDASKCTRSPSSSPCRTPPRCTSEPPAVLGAPTMTDPSASA
jgi:trehalose utilization protein